MTRTVARIDRGVMQHAAMLLAIAGVAWLVLLWQRDAMAMPGAARPSWSEAGLFTVQWGIMMTAMMLPSAVPMILLYRLVRQKLPATQRGIPPSVFAAIYLVVWMLTGIPVYFANWAVNVLAVAFPWVAAAIPYAIAATLASAGIYQLTPLKRGCLEKCEAPLPFLMHRWRAGNGPSTRIAVAHAAYCIGCCWLLMVVLVTAGAMSLAWVVTIAFVVMAEKTLPRTWQIPRITGVALVLLAAAVALFPELSGTLRGSGHNEHMNMPGM